MLTRENAIASIIAADPTQNFPVMASSDVELLINQIYNEHELQMKAKDEEIEKLKAKIKPQYKSISSKKDSKFYSWTRKVCPICHGYIGVENCEVCKGSGAIVDEKEYNK